MHYINLGLLLIIAGLVIGVYVHTDRKIDKLSDRMDRLSDRIDKLSDRIDRIYDILFNMGFRGKEYRDKAANE